MPESNYYGGTGTQIVSGQITPQQFSALLTRVQTVESSLSSLSTTVGSSSSGLVKAVSDLQTVVGDSSSGLVKRVSDLEAAAETSETSGSGGEDSGSGGEG